ncbi:MAG: hypothetical protein MK078_00365 [Crocinitomicaceae bacterium]|nr:hypothetical protein [Crocinitomicaceae bacterium]
MNQTLGSNTIFDTVTINDLKDRLYANETMAEDELEAIKKFDQYRLDRLSKIDDDSEFEKTYLLIRAEANMLDYRSFL